MQRRQLLILGGTAAGVLIVSGGGVALVLADRFRGWVRDILQRALPGYTLEENGLAQFMTEYNANKRHYDRLRVFAAVQNLIDTTWALPYELALDVEHEERQILTDFLIGSDFFENYPNGTKEVTYRGLPEACGNPFATF